MSEQVNYVLTETGVAIDEFHILFEEINEDCDCTGACAGSRVIGCAQAMCICEVGPPERAGSNGSVVLAAIAHALRNGLGYIEFEGDMASLRGLLSEHQQHMQSIEALRDTGVLSDGALQAIKKTTVENLLQNSQFEFENAVIRSRH